MFMGFIMHFYIIFGTNQLTQSPVPVSVFSLVSVFRRKGISNGVQTEWNLQERDFWNERDPGDLELKSRKLQGGHEVGRRAWPTSFTYIYPHTLKTSGNRIDREFHRKKPL